MRACRDRIVDGRDERSVSISRQDRDVVGNVIGNGEIRLPIAIEVRYCDARGAVPCSIRDRGLEGAIPVAQQDRHFVGIVVSNGEVGFAVAIEVSGTQRERPGAGGVGDRGMERAIALTCQD